MADREERFERIAQALGAALPPSFTVLDLGCGPGSLTRRLLTRFPRARAIGVDYDPVLLRIAERTSATWKDRVRWVDANLAVAGWADRLPVRRAEAAVSTTALHWLTGNSLRRLYRELAERLRPGGLFLNGDHLPRARPGRAYARLAERVPEPHTTAAPRGERWRSWSGWWSTLRREPALRRSFRLRTGRYPEDHPHRRPLTLEFHERALRAAGFRETGTIWQAWDDRLLYGIR